MTTLGFYLLGRSSLTVRKHVFLLVLTGLTTVNIATLPTPFLRVGRIESTVRMAEMGHQRSVGYRNLHSIQVSDAERAHIVLLARASQLQPL